MGGLEYLPVKAMVSDGDCDAVSFYGVRVLDNEGSTVLELPDISGSEERVEKLIAILKANDVETNHIIDVIEDFFWS